MTNEKFHDLFGGAPRNPDEPLTQRHMDLAASIQTASEEVALTLTRALAAEIGAHNLCLAGGVPLTYVANAKVWRDRRLVAPSSASPAEGSGGGPGPCPSNVHL